MAFTNYSDLKTEIANYLGRSDLTSQIPTFIRLAEERLARDLRTRHMLKVSQATMTADDSTVALPSDFLAMNEDGRMARLTGWGWETQTQKRVGHLLRLLDVSFF